MSDERNCSGCGFWQRADDESEYGSCLALPPAVIVDEEGPMSLGPLTHQDRQACIYYKGRH